MSDVVLLERAGAVATLTVNRPEALNALNAEVVARLTGAVADLDADPAARVIVITGQGPKAFVAGADITQFVEASPAAAEQIALAGKAMHDRIAACRKPVIASINGFCLGGGLELALACDIRIAAANARFGLPEIKLGIMPGGGGTVRLARLAGASLARALAMTGDMIEADRALAAGLVAAVHPPEKLADAARVLAEKLAALSPFALAQLKSVLDIGGSADIESACLAEIKAFALCFSTEDQREGTRAFLEKRPPIFHGR
jgi:enoyl-CoA hydratase